MAILRRIRSLLVSVRDAWDRRLHPRRRAAARERLRALRPSSVLFVCLGNICRSPFGERVLASKRGDTLAIASAGFIGPGRPPPESALEAAARLSIDHADHRSTLVTPTMLRTADVIFIFDRYNRRNLRRVPGFRPDRTFWLGDFDPEWSGKRAISDPWGHDAATFDAAFARIARCTQAVVTALDPGAHPAPRPDATRPDSTP